MPYPIHPIRKVKTRQDWIQDIQCPQLVPSDSLLQNIVRLNLLIDEAYQHKSEKQREALREVIVREKMKLLVSDEVYKAACVEEKKMHEQWQLLQLC